MGPISKYVELNFGGIISPKAGQTILQMASSRERDSRRKLFNSFLCKDVQHFFSPSVLTIFQPDFVKCLNLVFFDQF